jgi:hypothetical protein
VDSVFKMDSKCAVQYSTNGTGLADHNRTCSSHVYRTVYKYEAMFGCYKFTIESGSEGILKFVVTLLPLFYSLLDGTIGNVT